MRLSMGKKSWTWMAAGMLLTAWLLGGPQSRGGGFESGDLARMRSAGAARISPDGRRIAYTVEMFDRPGRPYAQVWILELASQKTVRVGGEKEATSNPQWSPDGKWLSYFGRDGEKAGLMVARSDGTEPVFLAEVQGTNSPLPGQGSRYSWSPDSREIVYVSSTPGPETGIADGDPRVITRYLYKPDLMEGNTRFNDNRRLHLFVVDRETRKTRQLTTGTYDEHSVDWSPDGKEILFVSNREPNADEFFNYDVFALRVADGTIRRLTATESCEYAPRWSPDGKRIAFAGTKRGLTDRETTMEDAHVWLMDADGKNRREAGAEIDNRQGMPGWSPDGKYLYFTVQERGNTRLVRLPAAGGKPEVVVGDAGAVGAWSAGSNNEVAYSFTSPGDMGELYLKTNSGTRRLTDLNADALKGKTIAAVESFTFTSNDNRFEIEAYLTKPAVMKEGTKHPLIVNIHGGPHGQNGPAFDFKNQVYASKGWAVLQVNYRGSTGYGQKFADAVFGDQDGYEAQDVLYGVSAAVRRNLWIDRERMGIEGRSYGGQLTEWLITQTNEFKAAIPMAGITNLISYNYMTYYNQYEEMEFGQFLHQGNLMDLAWERSALKYAARVRTPTMILHGENDNDVPIAEAEQFFIALKDANVDTVFVRYPREGHGLREVGHVIDSIDRSIAWYEKHFPRAGEEGVTNVQP